MFKKESKCFVIVKKDQDVKSNKSKIYAYNSISIIGS